MKHKSIVFLSDITHHDTSAVNTVQKMLIPHVKQSLHTKKIIYFSDDAKQNFRSKYQMVNSTHHDKSLGIKADWYFHATARVKSFSDGIWTLYKREAVRNSLLRKPTKAILTPQKPVECGQNHFKNIKTLFYSEKENGKVSKSLKRRFDKAPTVQQMLRNH